MLSSFFSFFPEILFPSITFNFWGGVSRRGLHSINPFVYDDSAATEYEISHKVIAAKEFQNLISGSLVLEENDVLRLKASVGGNIEGFVSILEINRD